LFYRHIGPDAAANCCPVDPQTAADLWHNGDRRLPDGGK
jgi:hypothetical protein